LPESSSSPNPSTAVAPGATLQPGENLADVFLEALQRADRPLADDLVAPAHAHLRVAHDLAFRHVRAADGPELRDDEDLTNLGLAERRLADLGRQHAGQRGFEIVDRLVDDVVAAAV